jgi:transcriptional regulator with XRE-family HTH domain
MSGLLERGYASHHLPQALGRLGVNIYAVMMRESISVNQLAAKTLVPVNTIKGILRGDNFPSYKTLALIAKGLGVQQSSLITGASDGA